jgi:glycosyltransferase involved in cell wall biosynthesis
MRILYLINTITGSGGLQKIILDKANYMVEYWGFEVHFLCGRNVKKDILYNVNHHLNIHYVHPKESNSLNPNRFARLIKYKSIIKEINPDMVIVCNNKIEDFLVPFLTNKRTLKEIHGSYQSLIYGYRSLMGEKLGLKVWKAKVDSCYKQLLFPRLLSHFDHAVFLTKEDKRLWNVPNGTVIHNFVESKQDVTCRNNVKSYFAIAIGRLEKNKGFIDLIKAWKKVVSKHVDLKLKIFGVGRQEQELKNLIAQLKLIDNVALMGYSSHIWEEYPNASILVSATYTEGFSLIIAEAQTCGLPAIFYDAPNGPKEIINHGVDGLLCPVGNIEEFAKNVLMLAEDEKLLDDMSKNAVKNAKRFDKYHIMQQWYNLLKRNE